MQKWKIAKYLFDVPLVWTILGCIMQTAKVLNIHSKLMPGGIKTENRAFLTSKCILPSFWSQLGQMLCNFFVRNLRIFTDFHNKLGCLSLAIIATPV